MLTSDWSLGEHAEPAEPHGGCGCEPAAAVPRAGQLQRAQLPGGLQGQDQERQPKPAPGQRQVSFKHFTKPFKQNSKIYLYTFPTVQVQHAAAAGPGDAAQHHNVPRPAQRLQVATDSAQVTQALDIVISIYSIYSM